MIHSKTYVLLVYWQAKLVMYGKKQEVLNMTTEEELLVPNDEYLKSGIHIGTKFRTKYMENFIYKTRPDGLSVLNIQQINERLKILVSFLANYEPGDILVVCRRETGWKPVNLFAQLTGVNAFAGRYSPGVLTNPKLKHYRETKLMLVVDAWPDKNAVTDAINIGIPVIALCDTNNQSNNIDLVIPCNNKGKKSLGLVFYILSKYYMLAKGLIAKDSDFKYEIGDFTDE